VKERKPAELVIDPNQSIVQRGGGSGWPDQVGFGFFLFVYTGSCRQ
jgi:hypothetical protein